jgi:hypothetical protein
MPNKGCFSTSSNLPGYNRVTLTSPITDPGKTTLFPHAKNLVQNILVNQSETHEVGLKYSSDLWSVSISQPYNEPITYARPQLLVPEWYSLQTEIDIVHGKESYDSEPYFMEIAICNDYVDMINRRPSVSITAYFDTGNCFQHHTGESLSESKIQLDKMRIQHIEQLWPKFIMTGEPVFPYSWFKDLKIMNYDVGLSQVNSGKEILLFEILLSKP